MVERKDAAIIFQAFKALLAIATSLPCKHLQGAVVAMHGASKSNQDLKN